MNKRLVAGLAIGLALPLTFGSAVLADYTDEQEELVERILGDDDDDDTFSLPVFGGIAITDEDGRRSGEDIYDDFNDAIVFGPDDD